MIEFQIGDDESLLLTTGVVDHLLRFRQMQPKQREAGGQLFARLNGKSIVVEEATGPRPSDRRTYTTYEPDRDAEQAEILDRHSRGLHFVGDWHTHPELRPRPSTRDIKSMAECVRRSIHPFRGFILAIIGKANPPAGFHLSLHDGNGYTVLRSRTSSFLRSNG